MTPPRLNLADTSHSNNSTYTLDTVAYLGADSDDDHDDRSPLLTPSTPSYGATFPRSPTRPSTRKVVFNATLKMACIFIASTLLLGGTLWLALPTLDEWVSRLHGERSG